MRTPVVPLLPIVAAVALPVSTASSASGSRVRLASECMCLPYNENRSASRVFPRCPRFVMPVFYFGCQLVSLYPTNSRRTTR